MRRRFGAVVVAGLLIVAACGGPSPTASPPAPTPSASPTSTPAEPSPSPSVAPASPASGFACSFPVTVAGTAAGSVQAVPTAVRIGGHTGYDRIVFEYSGLVRPTLEITAVSPPFVRDPSGLPMTVAGSSFLRFRLDGVRSGGAGRLTFLAKLPELTQLTRQGDFEAVQSWIAGLVKPGCVRIQELSGPTRIVVDLQH